LVDAACLALQGTPSLPTYPPAPRPSLSFASRFFLAPVALSVFSYRVFVSDLVGKKRSETEGKQGKRGKRNPRSRESPRSNEEQRRRLDAAEQKSPLHHMSSSFQETEAKYNNTSLQARRALIRQMVTGRHYKTPGNLARFYEAAQVPAVLFS
jgi:hypothetical protein